MISFCISCWYPIQRWWQFTSYIGFVVVYSLFGIIYKASLSYFDVTLTTLERRFKIPSQTTGIILSGNEISQILLSLILVYFGSKNNNTLKWIAWGICCIALSFFILASPHLIYGAGEEALQYTREYLSSNESISPAFASYPMRQKNKKICQISALPDVDYTDEFSYVPLFLIFLSQFVLGIGNTLFTSLGPTYIDDNTKQGNSPLILSLMFAVGYVGPMIGYGFAYIILRFYIAPTLTPLIPRDDYRWMGAWWLGWILIGTLMLGFAGIIWSFPKNLKRKVTNEKDVPNDIQCVENFEQQLNDSSTIEKHDMTEKSGDLRDFSKAIWRLLTNKLLVLKCFSNVFISMYFIATGVFLGRVLEVQFNTSSAVGGLKTGPLTMVGRMIGTILSGWIVKKFKPPPKYLFLWSVIVGITLVCANLSFTQLGCDNSLQANEINGSCNVNCVCDRISYSPVCDSSTGTTYFSACHAGCRSFNAENNSYTDCVCSGNSTSKLQLNVTSGACAKDCSSDYYAYTFILMASQFIIHTILITIVLIGFRSVEPRDKALAQGFEMFIISLFASIPGVIIFGRIIDSTCLHHENGQEGNCLLYDSVKFRYYFHSTAAFFVAVSTFLYFLIWCFGKNLDLYGDKEPKQNEMKDKCSEQCVNE